MRVVVISLLTLLIAIAVSCQGPVQEETIPVEPVSSDEDDFIGQIKANNRKFEEAVGAGDAAAVATLYTEEATLMPPEAESIRGREEIEALWSKAIESGIKSIDLRTIDVEANGDLAYEIGKVSLGMQQEGQEVAESTGKYLVVWKRGADDFWRLHVDIWNSIQPTQ